MRSHDIQCIWSDGVQSQGILPFPRPRLWKREHEVTCIHVLCLACTKILQAVGPELAFTPSFQASKSVFFYGISIASGNAWRICTLCLIFNSITYLACFYRHSKSQGHRSMERISNNDRRSFKLSKSVLATRKKRQDSIYLCMHMFFPFPNAE